MKRWVVSCLILAVWPSVVLGQPTSAVPRSPEGSGAGDTANALTVFLDCQDHTPCFQDYMKTEITYVDYVTVREAADVHVLVTTRGTGAGGREYTLKFVGQGAFREVEDEVLYSTLPTDSEELVRRGLARTLQLGLVRYALHTRLGSELEVSRRSPQGAAAPGQARSARDPWNYWVFRTRFNLNAESESSNTSRTYTGNVSAGRITDAWKISVTAFRDYRRNDYTFSSGETYRSIRRGFDLTGMAIKSLTDHWSAGGKAFVSSSTYENKDRTLNATGGVEFNVFPYRESTRRQLTFQYLLGVTAFSYNEETVYGKMRETVASHAARGSFDFKQTWGSVSSDFDWSQYLHDRRMSRRTFSVEADIRLFRGFSFNINARASTIHDQLYLPKGEATDEEVLARQRQLATSFRRSVRFGISYTFGSVFSNVVNTRLGNLVGGDMMRY